MRAGSLGVTEVGEHEHARGCIARVTGRKGSRFLDFPSRASFTDRAVSRQQTGCCSCDVLGGTQQEGCSWRQGVVGGPLDLEI